MISIATAEETTGLSADGWTWAYRSAVTQHGWLSTFFVSITGHL